MSQFSTHQTRKYQRLFSKFIPHDSGTIGLRELYFIMPHFGPQLPPEDIQTMIYEFDSDCDGRLDFDDFLNLLAAYEAKREKRKEDLKKAFQQFETSFSGLSWDTLTSILKTGTDPLSDDEIQFILGLFYPDSDLNLLPNEFVRNTNTNTYWRNQLSAPRYVDDIKHQVRLTILQAQNLLPLAS
eukprot:TRINITY_DN9364_c0_g1_i5.p2 TRINITY_DN9364_c0_g1~~TRINITY_DN9364_c0_g1_i5.p2  ORF type:complete len:184 (-),score=36.46 TRINITY_DN9364_c0_g1_i5:31-582(-)